MSDTVHHAQLVNHFWPHCRAQAVCPQCLWFGTKTHVRAAQAEAAAHLGVVR